MISCIFGREPDSGVLQEGGMLLVGLANGKVAMFPVLELLHVCSYCKFGNFCKNFIFTKSIKRHSCNIKIATRV